jgi:hypothetical protein
VAAVPPVVSLPVVVPVDTGFLWRAVEHRRKVLPESIEFDRQRYIASDIFSRPVRWRPDRLRAVTSPSPAAMRADRLSRARERTPPPTGDVSLPIHCGVIVARWTASNCCGSAGD